jgi:chlorophyll synthase
MRNINKENKNIIFVFLKEIIRIRGVITWSAISFIGFILGLSSMDIFTYFVPFLFFIVSSFCILSFTFAINNYYDAESDMKNPRRRHINAFASGKITKRTGIILNTIFVIIPLVLSFLFKLEVFLFCIVLLFWMWIYSAPPFRLKGRPGMDLVWHFFAFVFLVLWGSMIAETIDVINWMVAISFGIWSLIAQVWNHISDISFDKDSGTETYAVKEGVDTTKTTLKIIVIIHMILLIPLIILYSLNYLSTFIVLIAGIVITVVATQSKKDFPISSNYYASFLFAGVVYLNCLIYHISILLDIPIISVFPILS